MLCVNCGGKGFYLLMQGFPSKSLRGRQGEIVACNCEKGFKYSQLGIDDNG